MLGIEFQYLGIAQFVKSIIRYLVNLFSSEILDVVFGPDQNFHVLGFFGFVI